MHDFHAYLVWTKEKDTVPSEHGNIGVGRRGLKEENVCGPRDKVKDKLCLSRFGLLQHKTHRLGDSNNKR